MKKQAPKNRASVAHVGSPHGLVTRQSVYAHFRSREQLLPAIVDRITEEIIAAMDAADLHTGPAADALLRLLDD
ncbi:hypothetical protein [Streptomyces sp. NPDC059278]|uniref:hypothetical protein n=1 Tax=Streptomyces sp. NPDC059278 TaxID=3346801 RepID=UPI0036850787